MHLAPPIGDVADPRQSQQRAAVALARDRQAQPLQYRRHDIDRLGEAFHFPAASGIGGGRRVAQDQRHLEGLVGIALLAQQPMVAQHLAMVGGDDDQRVVVEAPFLQPGDQPADLVIDLPHHAAIGRPELRHRAVVEIEIPPEQDTTPLAEALGGIGQSG